MTGDQLTAKLKEKAVPEQLFSLDGLKNAEECYCVVRDGGAWKVVYTERGKVSEIARGLTQADAYDLVYEEFRTAYGWPK